tara:strand:+ start:26296 stop:27327 length:1032 start_codon:yes stop_codon:yes gene_type:complete
MKFRYLIFLYIYLSLISCGTSNIFVDIQRPADITVPQHIESVIIANRSVAGKGNKIGNIVEGLLTGESIGSDRKGSQFCVQGLSNMLTNSKRYVLKGNELVLAGGTGTSQFPNLLTWEFVDEICSNYGSDALIVLSTFDSDSRIIEGKEVVKTKKVNGAKIKEVQFPVTLIMEIQSGWRIYDNINKEIIDVSTFTEIKEYKEWGGSYEDAKSKLPSNRDALLNSGIFAGEKYGFRITPVWLRESRIYYSGKIDEFKLAKNYVNRGEWNQAIELWKDLTEHPDIKISRKAFFNLSLASEMNGSLETAIDYARKAEQMGDKRASSYIIKLKRRQIDEEKLKLQVK